MTETQTEDQQRIADLVEQARLAMLTTMTADGKHVSRPMALQKVEFDGDLWFFTYDDSDKVHQIRAHPELNVSFSSNDFSAWISIAGRAELVHDPVKAAELYSPALRVWFPDGLETPGLALIKVHADTAEYWDSPASRVKKLVGAVRAAATGDPDKFPGENRTVQL